MITFLLFLALPFLITKHILLFIKYGFDFKLASKMDTLGDFFKDIFSFFNLYFKLCIEPSVLFGHLWSPLRLTCSTEFIGNTAHMEIEMWGLCRGHLEVWLTPNSSSITSCPLQLYPLAIEKKCEYKTNKTWSKTMFMNLFAWFRWYR